LAHLLYIERTGFSTLNICVLSVFNEQLTQMYVCDDKNLMLLNKVRYISV